MLLGKISSCVASCFSEILFFLHNLKFAILWGVRISSPHSRFASRQSCFIYDKVTLNKMYLMYDVWPFRSSQNMYTYWGVVVTFWALSFYHLPSFWIRFCVWRERYILWMHKIISLLFDSPWSKIAQWYAEFQPSPSLSPSQSTLFYSRFMVWRRRRRSRELPLPQSGRPRRHVPPRKCSRRIVVHRAV